MELRKLLRLRAEPGSSDRSVAKILGISKNTVKAYYRAFIQSNLPLEEVLRLTDKDLAEVFYKSPEDSERLKTLKEEIPLIVGDLGKRGVDRKRLWVEYRERHPDGYAFTQFSLYMKQAKQWAETSLRMEHKAGDKLFVDFAGGKLSLFDRKTREEKKVEVLVTVLPYSGLAYVEALESQKIPQFIRGLGNALEYFGGTPALIVTDNLKSAVTRAHRYEPKINRTFREFCEHYKMETQPARPGAPQDKAHVENMVKIVYRKIFAPLRNEPIFDLDTLNERIHELLEKMNNAPRTDRPESRRELFEAVEKETLRPLPADRYEPQQYEMKKVDKFCFIHISEDKSAYSVPYIFVGKTVLVAYSDRHLTVYHEFERIAYHVRTGKRQNLIPEHLPPKHRPEVLDWDEERILAKGAVIGPETVAYLKAVMAKSRHPFIGFRLCAGILSLAKESRYGSSRLNEACKRALLFQNFNYSSIESILKNKLDENSFAPVQYSLPQHENLRNDYH